MLIYIAKIFGYPADLLFETTQQFSLVYFFYLNTLWMRYNEQSNVR